MAKQAGTLVKFEINGNQVGRTKNLTFTFDPGLIDTPQHGDTWNDTSQGLKAAEVSIDGWYDLSDVYQLEMHTAALAGTTVSGDAYVNAANYWYGNWKIGSYSWTGDVTGIVEFSMGLKNSGTIAYV